MNSIPGKEGSAGLSQDRARLLELLMRTRPGRVPAIARSAREPHAGGMRARAGGSQQRLWFIDQLGGSIAYHIPLAMRLHGFLDRAALQAALNGVIERHEALRTCFVKVDGEVWQQIAMSLPFPLQCVDLSALAPYAREAEAMRQARADLGAPFDLGAAPLMRGRLLQLTPDEHLLVVTLHHIVADGWSISLLVRELGSLYEACREEKPDPLPPLNVQYADYVQWQRQRLASTALQEQRSYWKMHLEGAPELLALPTDRPRPAVQGQRGASVRFELGVELSAELKAFSQSQNLTLAMTLYAAWSILMSRLTGQTDIVVGLPVANRCSTELEAVVGFFVNTLAVRVRLDDDPSVGQLLQRVKEILLAAYANQDVPFEQVVEALQPARSLSHSPVFQVMFSMQSAPPNVLRLPGLTVTREEVPIETAHFDLTLYVQESTSGITGQLNYAAELFDVETIEHWAACFSTVLRGIVRDRQQHISRLPLLGEKARRHVMALSGATSSSLADERLAHELFEAQAQFRPHAPAVVYEGRSLTYGELNARANRLARYLRNRGVGPDRLVALYLERNVEMVVALLAVLKAGGAYVPLDPIHPPQRIAEMLVDSDPVAVLTQTHLSERLEIPSTCALMLQDVMPGRAPEWEALPAQNLDAREIGQHCGHLAYVIYTSGSTGRPKGVMIEHRNLLYFVHALEGCIHGLQPQCDRVAWNSSFGFDMAVKAWAQLTRGRTVYLLPESVRLSGEAMLAYIEQHRIEAIECTPSHLRMMQDAGFLDGRGQSLSKVLLGGEAIDADLWRTLTLASVTTFFNMYGPTECTVDASCGTVEGPSPNVGRVMPAARIYILDAHREPVPPGVVGEIYIGGAGVARGYLKRADLTAERFLPDPFSADPRERMYRTGDLGRWRADGTIQYCGRNDHQVKIRGFRIELGEIEAHLAQHAHVKDVAVVTCDDAPGLKRLVAYVVPRTPQPPSAESLRSHLQATLPEHMLPSAFVMMERLPLTANGKLDRRALPAPDASAFLGREYEAPQGEIEEIVATIWQGLLHAERIGRGDNFFELGGHSLLIMQMMERLRRVGLAVEARRVFENPVLADLARVLSHEEVDQYDVPPNLIPPDCEQITPAMLPLVELEAQHIERIVRTVPGGSSNLQDVYPLVALQEGILFHHLLNEHGGDAYVLSIVFLVSARERVEELIRALQTVIDRHDALRTAVVWEQLPRPVQVVYRRATLPVEEVRFATDRDPAEQIAEWMAPDRQRMDLRRAPLMRLTIAADPLGTQWYVLLQLHHIADDATSRKVMVAEVVAQMEGRAQAEPIAVAYREHVAQSLVAARKHDAEAFFRSRLADIDEPTVPFGLIDVHADGTRTDQVREELDPALARRIRSQARRLGVSAATLFHAAWALVVARTSARSDVVFGTVLLGRMQGRGGSQRALGMFINTLPLRLQLKGVGVAELVEQTQRELVELLGHEQASLAAAQRFSGIPGSTPLFSALLNYRHGAAAADASWDSARGIRVLRKRNGTNYPITLSVDDLGQQFALTAQTDRRLDPRRITGYLRTAMQSLIDALEQVPQMPALSVAVLPEQECRQVIELFNATQAAYPTEVLIHQLFEEQVRCTPDAIALVLGDESFTYREINSQANKLARHLRSRGVGPDRPVGICVDRSPAMVIAILAVLKAGGAYVPLDSSYPPERLTHMVADAAPAVLLTQRRLRALVPPSAAQLVDLDEIATETSPYEDLNLPPADLELTPRNLVYLIYTSGSTGRPKGTGMTHHAMVNLIEWHRRDARLGGNQRPRVLQFAALSFDVAFQEIFSTLCAGGTLVLLDEWVRRDVRALTELLVQHCVERLFVPPLMLQNLAEHYTATGTAPRALRDVIVAGEQLRISPEIVGLFKHLRTCRLHNHYGPTETHVVTALTLPDDPDDWPVLPTIGRPIANTQIYILDSERQPVPFGVAGEIYIGGRNVARGYLNRPDLSAERFLADPFCADPSARMYKTGDLGRWCEDGAIEYLGRNDDQVKIRGFRIELAEIEARLAQHEAVHDVAVVACNDTLGHKRLVAYVTAREQAEPCAEALRVHLRAALPEYMTPSVFVVLDQLPLTPSGKLNRRALPPPDLYTQAGGSHEPPQGEVEEMLARIWRDLLGVQGIGRQDSFFDVGGHSLLVLQALFRTNRSLGCTLRVTDMYKNPKLCELAARISTGTFEDVRVDLEREAALDDDIVPIVGQPAAAKVILLTGATGFVGRFLLAQLLETSGARIYCLVRSSSAPHAIARLKSAHEKWDLWRAEFEERVVAIPGDLRLPYLGMDRQTYEALSRSVDSIYHCGTSMNHLETYAMAKAANVDGVRELLRFATRHRAKLTNFISTLGVFSAETTPERRVISEGTSIESEVHWGARGYVASKWVGERIFLLANARGVPCNIFRVGLVWADTQRGRYDELQRGYRLLKSCLISGCGIENYRYDMPPTPVDYVARAIVFLGSRYRGGGEIFHISSPHSAIEGLFERCNEIVGTSLTLLSYYDWIREMKRLHHGGRSLPVVPLVEFAFAMDQATFNEHQRTVRGAGVRFDCTRTQRELERAGIVAPVLDDDLLYVCVRSMLERDDELQELAPPSGVLTLPRAAGGGAARLAKATG